MSLCTGNDDGDVVVVYGVVPQILLIFPQAQVLMYTDALFINENERTRNIDKTESALESKREREIFEYGERIVCPFYAPSGLYIEHSQ